MNETVVQDSRPLLERMVAAKQLSSIDAKSLAAAKPSLQTEEDVLRWLAEEYGLAFTTLDDVEPDRQLLSLFPARILLKEELLPLQRTNGTIEVATSRLFATQGLYALKTMTGLNLKPILATSETIQREIKKRLGVGADTIGTLDEKKVCKSSMKTPRTTISTKAQRTRLRSSVSSTRFSRTRLNCARRTFTSNRSRTNFASAIALTVCCRTLPFRRSSSVSSQPSFRASKF